MITPLRVLHGLVGLIVAATALGLLAWTVSRLEHERQTLVSVLAAQRREQLAQAASDVEEGLRDIHEDLEFTTSTVVRATSDHEMVHDLEALLWLARPYRAVGVYDEAGVRSMLVVDPGWGRPLSPDMVEAMDATAQLAHLGGEGPAVTSVPILDPSSDLFRVFARRGATEGLPHRTVAFLVDTRPILSRLATVSGDRMASLLVLGPHGSAVSVSEPRLAAAVTQKAAPASFQRILASMRQQEAGVDIVAGDEARRMGFPEADLLVVRVPIRPEEDGPAWSAATFVSTQEISGLESETARALAVAAGLGTALLLGFGAYVAGMVRRDATVAEQLRTAGKVAHLRDRAERILDHIPVCVAAVAPDGRVTSFNGSYARRFPRSAAGGSLADALPDTSEETLARLQELMDGATESERAVSIVGERLRLGGEEGEFSIHAVPIRPASDDVGSLLVIEDHTPLQRLRDRILRVEKLATVGVLAAGIAHEVGTPLGVIRGRAEFAAQKLGPGHPQTPALGTIVEQIDRIVRIIRALLDFASPRPVLSGRVDLLSVSEKVRELVSYELQRRTVALAIEIEGEGRYVQGNEDQMQQVLVNLVMNAVDASRAGALVRIASSAPDAEQVLLTVEDQGSGIAAENLHRIFDPFFTTKKRGHGTGLGLAIVDQIVRDHGGTVLVQSEVSKGSVFHVTLSRFHRQEAA
jgi:two-component system sensor histidine kinase HydH